VSVLCEHPAAGTATVFFGASGRQLRFRCDTLGHQIVVTDQHGQILRTFGGHGRTAGLLDTPLDVVVVRPEFAGERLPFDSADALWLAVADYGNRRVQVFDLDGVPVGHARPEARDGAPWAPTRLTWKSPRLVVEGIEGATVTVHLSAALLAAVSPSPADRVWPRVVSGARH
jgi:YD repeat-containing protein